MWRLIKAVRQRFCRHAWEYTRWQALIADGRGSIVCTKCGKRDRALLRVMMHRALDADQREGGRDG